MKKVKVDLTERALCFWPYRRTTLNARISIWPATRVRYFLPENWR